MARQLKLMPHTAADIRKSEQDDQVISPLSLWESIERGVTPTMVFDSGLTACARCPRP
ncbi:MAG: hypothetical protein AB2L07_18355 [Thermoanaerobaculaceae bacterium]